MMCCVNLPFRQGNSSEDHSWSDKFQLVLQVARKVQVGIPPFYYSHHHHHHHHCRRHHYHFILFVYYFSFTFLRLLFSLFWILNAPMYASMYARYKKHRHWLDTGSKPWYGQPRTNCWIWLTHVICFLEHPWKNGRFSRKTEEVRRLSLSFVCCFVSEYNIC